LDSNHIVIINPSNELKEETKKNDNNKVKSGHDMDLKN